MSPPISKDLWLAAAITSTTLPTALAQPAPATGSAPPAPAGIVAAITPGAQIKSNDQILYVGSNALPGQRITTGKNEVLHVLLQDQSALTLGPESELVIDEFRYDESTRKGKIRLSLRQGFVRVVGGYISKNEPTEINTPHALVEISGGITVVETKGSATQSTFLFGRQMSVSNPGGTQTVTRPGFGVTSSSNSPPTVQPNPRTPTMVFTLPRNDQTYTLPGSGHTISIGKPTQIAPDRVDTEVSYSTQTNPSQTLTNILGAGQTPIAS